MWASVVGVAIATYAAAFIGGRPEYVVAGGLSLAVPLIFAWRLEAGILLAVVARPSLDLFADRTYASFAGVDLNPASVLGILVLVVAVPYMMERFGQLRRAPAIFPYLAFAGFAGLSVAVAPSTASAATEWLRLTSILAMYALAYLAATTPAAVARLLGAVVLSAALPIAVGMWQLAQGGTRQIGDFHRLTGTFLHPDPYGIYLALIAIAACAAALSGRSLWRWAAFATALGATAGLIGSYTRTGWVILAVGLLVLGVAKHRLLLLLTPLAVLLVFTIPATHERLRDVSTPKTAADTRRPGNSFESRVQLWRDNLPAARDQPLTGKGLDFIVHQTSNAAHVHSDFVRALVETGMFGFAAYVSLLAAALGGAIRSVRRTSRSGSAALRAASLAGLGTATAYILASVDSNLMTQVGVSGTAWALIACAHASGRIASSAGPRLHDTRSESHARLLTAPGVRGLRGRELTLTGRG